MYGIVDGFFSQPSDTHTIEPEAMTMLAYAAMHAVASGWLLITGVVAAFAKPSEVGGIALAVNVVASTAYALLASNRLILGMTNVMASATRIAVRGVDWLCTFPIMQLEIMMLLGLRPEAHVREFVIVPLLAAFVVVLDLALRVAFVTPRNATIVWGVVQLISLGLFVGMIVMLEMATPEFDVADRSTTLIFVYLWCAYPVVSLLGDLMRWTSRDANPEPMEDIAFTLLDVVSKGCLAAYIAFRS